MLCRLERTNEQTNVIPGCERLLLPEHFHSSTQLPTLIRWIPRTFYDKRQIVFILFYPRIFHEISQHKQPPTAHLHHRRWPTSPRQFSVQFTSRCFHFHAYNFHWGTIRTTNKRILDIDSHFMDSSLNEALSLPARQTPSDFTVLFCFENAKPTPPLGNHHSSTSLHSSVVHTRGLLQPECCIECHLLRTTSPLLLLVTNK